MAITLFEDTYCEVSTADSLLDGITVWDAAVNSDKEVALKQATKQLDLTSWLGTALSGTQPLAWPRAAFSFFDTSKGLSIQVEEGNLPKRLVEATAQLALHFLRYPSVIAGYEANYDSITIGPISLSNSNANSDPGKIPVVPSLVSNLLAPLTSNSLSPRPAMAWWRAN